MIIWILCVQMGDRYVRRADMHVRERKSNRRVWILLPAYGLIDVQRMCASISTLHDVNYELMMSHPNHFCKT